MNLTPWEDGWVLRPLRFLCRGRETHTNLRSTKKTSDFETQMNHTHEITFHDWVQLQTLIDC